MRGLFQKKKKSKSNDGEDGGLNSVEAPPTDGEEQPKEEAEEVEGRHGKKDTLEKKENGDVQDTSAPTAASISSPSSSFQYTAQDSIYGQEIPVETPELLSTKLRELEDELNEIPTKQKQAWLNALQKCPELCGDDFKLMFLRCEIFNSDLAAKRLVKYWTKRLEIFGESEEKAYLPLLLGEHGPFNIPDDEESMSIGFLRYTGKTDAAGRPIIFGDPSRMPKDQSLYDNKSMCRALWYVMHYVLKDETAQRKGAVVIMYPKNVVFAQFNRKLAQLNAESIKGCIPIRLSALHICHPPKVFDLIFPVLKVLMGSKLRKKIRLNSGSEGAVLDKFEEKFGITRADLPTELGGMLVIDNEGWLEERRRCGE